MPYRHHKGNPESLINDGTAGASNGMSDTNLAVNYVYLTGIVKEVISNPDRILSRAYQDPNTGQDILVGGEKVTVGDILSEDKQSGVIELENSHWSKYMPLNSIIAYVVDDNNTDDDRRDVICFPFFPPHFSLPIKPGEYVWIVKEDTRGQDVYYWMCRKVGIRQLDDLNLTHLERNNTIVDSTREASRTGDFYSDDDIGDLVNFTTPHDTNLNRKSTFDLIAQQSIAYNEEFTGEPVPRQEKKCGDLLFQGSNNAHIMIGTEKFLRNNTAEEPEYSEDTRQKTDSKTNFFTGRSSDKVIKTRTPLSPAIDICIGRKFDDILSFKNESKSVSNGSQFDIIVGSREDENPNLPHMEVNKVNHLLGKEQKLQEFTDLNALNCMSRLYMSNTQLIDNLFDIPENGAEPQAINAFDDYSNLVAYSTNIRVVGDETVKIYNRNGNSMLTMHPSGKIELGNNSGAKINMLETGDIEIIPGSDGKVYIGGPVSDAPIQPVGAGGIQDLSLSTEDVPLALVEGTGNIVTSAAGLVVEPAGTGKLSTKVRLK